MRRPVTFLLTLGVLLGAPAATHASSFTVSGMTFDLQILGLTDPSSPSGSYNFQLTLNSSGYTAPLGSNQAVSGTDYLGGFAIDFGTIISTASLTSPSSGWTTTTGGINTTGCQNGPNDTLCAQTSLTTTVLNGATYTWLFSVDFLNDPNYSPPSTFSFQPLIYGTRVSTNNGSQSSYKSNYSGTPGTLSFTPPSTPTPTPVPEPTSLLLLGSGLLLSGLRRRRV
jgi:hypothetical protein